MDRIKVSLVATSSVLIAVFAASHTLLPSPYCTFCDLFYLCDTPLFVTSVLLIGGGILSIIALAKALQIYWFANYGTIHDRVAPLVLSIFPPSRRVLDDNEERMSGIFETRCRHAIYVGMWMILNCQFLLLVSYDSRCGHAARDVAYI